MKVVLHLLTLLFLNILVARSQKSAFRCDYTYFEDAQGYLKYHKIPANWYDARLRCHLEGATLASPLNTGLTNSMLVMLKSECPDCRLFIGTHATFSKEDYFSIEGVPLSNIPHTWETYEPNNFGDNERCLVIDASGKLADKKCSDPLPYICYKNETSNMMVNNCGTIDNEYKLDNRTGSCYKFHTVPRIWSRAYMACAAEGGYLTILNNDTEAQVIEEIFAKHPPSSIIGNLWKDVAYVGFQDWNEHGEWLTINGETLQDAGYAKFSAGEPNNMAPGEFCGSVYRNALLNDLTCETPHAFICEKDPKSLTVCEESEILKKKMKG